LRDELPEFKNRIYKRKVFSAARHTRWGSTYY
jgi:hypothetical protein